MDLRRNQARALWLIAVVVAGVAMAVWGAASCEGSTALPVMAPVGASPSTFVDEATCQRCHATEYQAWQSSHHHQAMRPATEETVLGDFDERTLETDVEVTRFFRRDGAFWIATSSTDGPPSEHRVEYTFGVEPLQQYLLRMENGSLQAHGAAWDVSSQRWFHLYEGEAVNHHHRLHWSGAQQNADFMCIECHTTGFRRSYDAAEDTYDSHWEALGVGCQSCHGPASDHVRWAEDEARGRDDTKGFGHSSSHGVAHVGDPNEVAICARCHSRRTPLGNGFTLGEELDDAYLTMFLTAELYEVDGTIEGEVFEYGSFVQSRMHAVGVVCSDCHEPHGAELRAPGDALCARCHNATATPIREGIAGGGLLAKRYDDPSHHHHAADSAGARCVACHMPGKLYMGNDFRHDHSFSSPLPAQAIALSHSDACLDCHRADEETADEEPALEESELLAAFDQWYPGARPRDGGYARDLHAARHGLPGAAAGLLRQLARTDLPDVRRATLLAELPNFPSAAAQRAVARALQSPSAMVRRSAVEILGALVPPNEQVRLLTAKTDDAVRAVRLAAAWQLLQMPAHTARDRLQIIAEYEEVQGTMLDRAESQFNLAGVYQLTDRRALVAPALRRAIQKDPTFHPALIQLAQLLERGEGERGEGAPEDAARMLREALERSPAEASLWHALGLMHVRQGKPDDALEALRRAHELAPDDAELGYTLAVALRGHGEAQAGLVLLRHLIIRQPANRMLRQLLIAYLRADGLHAEADARLAELAAQNPEDPLVRQRIR